MTTRNLLRWAGFVDTVDSEPGAKIWRSNRCWDGDDDKDGV